jgi:hypothetical protein
MDFFNHREVGIVFLIRFSPFTVYSKLTLETLRGCVSLKK